jgi:hypothetical protein
MNGKKAKEIRRHVYGSDGSYRQRSYEFKISKIVKFKMPDPKDPTNPEKMKEVTQERVTLSGGPVRRLYQQAKKSYKDGRLQLS